MYQTITLHKLILYAYNETDSKGAVLAKKAIQKNPDVRRAFEEITRTQKLVDDSFADSPGPASATISAILNYSSSLALLSRVHRQ